MCGTNIVLHCIALLFDCIASFLFVFVHFTHIYIVHTNHISRDVRWLFIAAMPQPLSPMASPGTVTRFSSAGSGGGGGGGGGGYTPMEGLRSSRGVSRWVMSRLDLPGTFFAIAVLLLCNTASSIIVVVRHTTSMSSAFLLYHHTYMITSYQVQQYDHVFFFFRQRLFAA